MGAKQKTPKKAVAEKKAADDKIRVKKAADKKKASDGKKAEDEKKASDGKKAADEKKDVESLTEADVEVPTELASNDSGEGHKKRKARDVESSSTSPANSKTAKAWTTMFSG